MNNIKKNPVAIVLGGTEDHIVLIKKLQKHGYYVLLIDYYDNPPAKKFANEHIKESILKREAVFNIARQVGASLVIAACIDQALPTMAYVSEKLSLPCHLSYMEAMRITNKEQMKITFSKFKIPTSNFLILNKKDNVYTDSLTFPLVIKPLDANSSKGVTKVYDQNEIKQAVEYAAVVSRNDKIIIEEYVKGKEYSVDVVVKDKKAYVLMITENIKSQINSDHFTITHSLFDLKIHKEYKLIIEEIAGKIANSFCLDNVTLLIQLIINKEGVSVIEFSARIGGGSKYHFIKGVTGFDILDFYLNPYLIQNVSHIPQKPIFKYGSMIYLYAKNSIFSRLEGADQLKRDGVVADFFCYKTSGMRIENHATSSDRPAGYMILDNNFELFKKKHEKAKSEMKVLDEQDINVKIDI